MQPLRSPADWEQRRKAVLDGFQEAAGPLPDPEQSPLDLDIIESTRLGDVVMLSGSLGVDASDRVPLDIYLPAQFSKDDATTTLIGDAVDAAVPGMLALHPTGAPGRRIIGGNEPRPNRQYALEMAQRGYVVVAPDYMSFGDYDYDFAADDYVSGTMKGIVNHRRCVDLLSGMRFVDADRIGVIGHSLGGHNAIFVAVFDERIKVIASSCGWTPFHSYYNGDLKGWTSDRYLPFIRDTFQLDPDRVPFDFPELIAALAPRTFVSVSPIHDANFDIAGVRRAMPAAKLFSRLHDAEDQLTLLTPECEHDFPTDMRLLCYETFDRVFRFTPQEMDPDYSSELPRIAATEPEDALSSFEVIDGYEVVQTAAEPLLTDPVAAAFDADGRLYVAEMVDYSEQANDHLGRIRRLTDNNGDGIFDASTVFADGLSWPTAITCFDGGVFVGAAPDIFYLRDNNDDGIADHRETVFSGFGRTNVQGLLNSFLWGPDCRIYGATSSSGGEVTCPRFPDRKPVTLRSRDFSFDPRQLDIREETGGAQHGMSFDDFGHRFVCSNSDHAQAIVYDQRYLNANPFVTPAPARISIAADGGQAPVFRISPLEPWRIVRTRLRVSGRVKGVVEGGGRPGGYFTGSTGVTIYRGDAWPAEMRGQIVVGDVGSNIVHRKRLRRDGTGWVAERMDKGVEFVASRDNWFRPVQYLNGPDGCLHILDMYRETIEHPLSIPPEIKRHVDLTSGRDRGRIYRIQPVGYSPRDVPRLSDATNKQLVALLDHPSGWQAETAQRLLYERDDASIATGIQLLLKSARHPSAMIVGLSLLAHFDRLSADVLLSAMQHEVAGVRERAVMLSESLLGDSAVFSAVTRRAADEDARVRLQAAWSLGASALPQRQAPLQQLLLANPNDAWIHTAVLTSLRELVWPAFGELATGSDLPDTPSADPLLGEMLQLALRRPDAPDAAAVARQLGMIERPDLQEQLLGATFTQRAAWREQSEFTQLVDQIVARAEERLDADDIAVSERVKWIQSLALSTWSRQQTRLLNGLEPHQPPDVQRQCVHTLGRFDDVEAADALIERWSAMTPGLREQVRGLLLGRATWAAQLLAAIQRQELPDSAISSSELLRLADQSGDPLRGVARQLLEQRGSGSRDDIIKDYFRALAMPGDVTAGEQVYRKNCSTCHRVGDVGFEVGPSLLSARSRGSEFILTNLLDPNREVLPAWHDYVAVTGAGTMTNGILAGESSAAVTLRAAEAKETSISRSDLELLRDTGRSLMPDNLERELAVKDVADLLAWLNAQP